MLIDADDLKGRCRKSAVWIRVDKVVGIKCFAEHRAWDRIAIPA